MHHGETRALKDFTTYIYNFSKHGREKERALFERIVLDEKRHADYTFDLLVQLCGSEKKALQMLRKMQFWEWRRAWIRNGRWLSEKVYLVLSTLLYLVMAPLSLWIRWVRPPQSKWQLPSEGS
ncbi:MAG: hypothetical protein GY822_17930 [Deltaproteobacteria bacterium]|nr:hypothetical protein [Deltaproteobacteria bacterium]